MKNTITKEVVDVLTTSPDEIGFESMPSETDSPLNQSVKEGDVLGGEKPKNWNIWKPEDGANTSKNIQAAVEPPNESNAEGSQPFLEDAPEQDFGSDTTVTDSKGQPQNTSETTSAQAEEVFELPTATAKQAADTILGISNNVLAVGGGFFIKIRKHKDFYEFEEIVELIDTQNDKNVKRIQLDKDDKALLKPLLVAILKRKAKNLTPEQQLMGAALSILIKKAQVVMEVRAENEILVDRILDIVREERGIPTVQDTPDVTVSSEVPVDMPVMDFQQMTRDTAAIETEIDQEELPTENYEDIEDLYTNVVEVLNDTTNPETE